MHLTLENPTADQMLFLIGELDQKLAMPLGHEAEIVLVGGADAESSQSVPGKPFLFGLIHLSAPGQIG